MKYFIIILSLSMSLNSTVKKELTYLVSSSDEKFIDTLIIGTGIYNDETPSGYFSYLQQDTSKSSTIFQTFIRKESDFGFYFQLPAINKLERLKFFAPALYPRNLKVGESLEDIPLPDVDGSKIRKVKEALSKEESEKLLKMTPEEKAKFIQKLGKQSEINNNSSPDNNKDMLEIIADYRVLDNIYSDNPIVNDYVTVIESTSRSPKGEFKSVYYYHESIGFVYLTFMYKNVKYEVSLNGISSELINE